jgi:hypothetical protein
MASRVHAERRERRKYFPFSLRGKPATSASGVNPARHARASRCAWVRALRAASPGFDPCRLLAAL